MRALQRNNPDISWALIIMLIRNKMSQHDEIEMHIGHGKQYKRLIKRKAKYK